MSAMLNEAQYSDVVLGDGGSERPHMEANRWLSAVLPTQSRERRTVPESETFDLMGVKLVWTKDGGRPFPKPVLNAVRSLIEFADLPSDWNSYGGRRLSANAVPTVLHLVVRGHQSADVPRMHPLPDGGVGLTWRRGECELEFAVAADGSIEGLLTLPGADAVELEAGAPLDAGMAVLGQYLASR